MSGRFTIAAYFAMMIGSVTLQVTGTVIGIIGGLAGIYALIRVNRVAEPLEAFIKEQSEQVKQHVEAVEEIKPPNIKRK